MSYLPKLEDTSECTDDKMVVETIIDIFKNYRQQNEPPISEFENELLWLFSFIDAQATDKLHVLFECGFIFLQDKVGISISQIASTISLTNLQISQRIKSWTTQVWDLASKKTLISHFSSCDLRSWSLRKIPKTDPINQFISSKISLQTSQPVNEVNIIIPPSLNPVTVINAKIFDSRSMSNFTIFNDTPKQWIFNQEPKKSFVLT